MARKTVSKISVQVTADAAGLKRNLGEAGRTVRSFGGSVSRLGAAVGKMAAILGPIAAVIGAVKVLTASLQGLAAAMREVDQQRREAENFGLTLRNFKALELAARETGGNIDTLVDAMGDLQERIALAGQGEKGPVALFRELGVNFKELSMLAPDDALEQVARALSRVENRADRTRIEMELLGGSAHEVDAALLAIARNGLPSYRKAAEEVGVLTQAQAKEIEILMNTWDNFVDKITNVALKIGVMFAPALTSLIEVLEAVVDHVNWLIESFQKLGQMLGFTMGAVGEFDREAAALGRSGAGLSTFAADMKKAEEEAKKLAASREKLAKLEERLAEMSRPEIVAGVARQAGAVVASSAEGAARRAQIAAGQFRAMAEEARARRRAEDSAKKREELLREIEAHSRRIAESSPVEVREVEIAG